MCVTAHKPPPSLAGERLRAEGSSALREPHWSGGELGREGGGRRRDLRSVNQERESGGGRGLCCVEQHVDLEGHDVRKGRGKLLRVFDVNNPHKGERKKWVSQASARLSCCFFFFLSELKTQFDNNESRHFTSVVCF